MDFLYIFNIVTLVYIVSVTLVIFLYISGNKELIHFSSDVSILLGMGLICYAITSMSESYCLSTLSNENVSVCVLIMRCIDNLLSIPISICYFLILYVAAKPESVSGWTELVSGWTELMRKTISCYTLLFLFIFTMVHYISNRIKEQPSLAWWIEGYDFIFERVADIEFYLLLLSYSFNEKSVYIYILLAFSASLGSDSELFRERLSKKRESYFLILICYLKCIAIWLFNNYQIFPFNCVLAIFLVLNFWLDRFNKKRKKNRHSPYHNGGRPIKSQIINILGSMSKHNNSTAMLNVFNIKLKKDNTPKREVENNKNFVSKPKHYPPANKEWFNSIYSYNKNTTKLLPSAHHVILRLVRSYFNLYSRKLEKKIRSRRLRIRARRLSTNRILVSKPEVKHTSDKVVVTIYVYNRQKIYYLNKIKRIASIDEIDNLLPNKLKKALIKNDGPWPSNLKIELLRKKSIKVKSKMIKHKNMVIKMLNIKNKSNGWSACSACTANKFKCYEVKYLKDYVTKSLRREIFSIYFRQLLFFNKSKFDERYLLPLTRLANKVYNKKIEFNLVNLKYLYLNSYIFSDTLVTKLRNRKNRLLRVLKTSLLMFKLPVMNRTAVYDEIYNRKRKLQNLKVQDLTSDYTASQSNGIAQPQDIDVLELLLSKVDYHDSLLKLKNYKTYLPNNLMSFDYPLYLTNTILNFIKNKYVSGIRLEVAGRLTRRNTAARSVFKLRYKGNIKNMDSSFKGLPTVLLRGYAKSNLQYTNLKSRIRIGSFGLKGWVSSSS